LSPVPLHFRAPVRGKLRRAICSIEGSPETVKFLASLRSTVRSLRRRNGVKVPRAPLARFRRSMTMTTSSGAQFGIPRPVRLKVK
jgi:hypothetical protein